jgi:putative membrane protein
MDKFKNKYLNHEQVLQITKAVAEAERKTSGEIVPMIVLRSSSIGHLPFHVGLLLMTAALLVILGWEPGWFFAWKWQSLVGLTVFSFGAAFLLSRFHVVQRWMIPDGDEEAQVWQRAQAEWALHKFHKTQARTGIMIFVSIMERKAVVLADEGIARHYPADTWKDIVSLLTGHLHRNEWVLGFTKAIEKCGEVLAKHLPAGPHNPNEVSDQLIIKP